MATFYEVKQLLCRFLGVRNEKENDDDIIIDNPYFFYGQQDDKKILISNTELRELYNKVTAMNNNGFELYTESNYEIALDSNYTIKRSQTFPIISKDETNDVEYELGYPTVEYCFYLLMMLKDAMNQQGRNNRFLLRYGHFYNNDEHSLDTILPKLIGVMSLKIKNTSAVPKSLKEFSNSKTAFVFEFMYKTGKSLVEYINITDMFIMHNVTHDRRNEFQLDIPPLRKYNEDVVDYYKQALASSDPYIKYISFYHVMEYFYDEVFKRKLITDLKDKITHPDFSYKNEDKIYEMALFVKNRLHANDETGQGDELESLKFVLNEYVPIDELRTRINAIDIDALTYYQNNKVSFCNAPVISWSDLQGVFTQIAKRIYFTRNSLVHSKSGKNKVRYRPYKDEKQLQFEIPLVKAVAESIIINSSEII